MKIPDIVGVRYVAGSGTSTTASLTVQTDVQRLGQVITWWLMGQSSVSFVSGDYGSITDIGHLGSTSVGVYRHAHGCFHVPSEIASPTETLDIVQSGSGTYYLLTHVYQNVDSGDPVFGYYIGSHVGSLNFANPPGGMIASGLHMPSNDYQPWAGLTRRLNPVNGGRMSGDEPASAESDQGYNYTGWNHMGTARTGMGAWMSLNPMRSQLPRRRFWYRRDRAMAGMLPLDHGVQVE